MSDRDNGHTMDELREARAEIDYLRRRCRILDKVLENLGVDYAAEVDKVIKTNPKLAEWPTLPGGE